MSLAEEITCLVLAELLLYPKDRPKRLNTYTTTQEKLAFLPKWSLTKQYMRRIPPTYGYYTERQCIQLLYAYCGFDTTTYLLLVGLHPFLRYLYVTVQLKPLFVPQYIGSFLFYCP